MKKTTVFTLAAVCGAFALALPDWKQPLNAAYPNPKFTLKNAQLSQSLVVSGCKPLIIKQTKTKTGPGPSTFNSLTLYDNYSYVLYRYATGATSGVPVTTVTGSWFGIDRTNSSTYYLSLNSASLNSLFSELDAAGLANCKLNPKLASMTQLDILAPTAFVTKNMLAITTKKNGAVVVSSALQISGKQLNDQKGTPNTLGTFSLKAVLTGGTWTAL